MTGPCERGSPDSSTAAQPSPKIAEPTVLARGSPGGGALEDAAHALGRHDQRLLAWVLAQRLRGQPHQRHAARAADAGHVVLVGRGVHLVVLDQAMGERRAAKRVEARAERPCRSAAGRARGASMARDRMAQQVVLDLRRAALRGCGRGTRRSGSRWRRSTPQRSKMPSANSSPRSPRRSSTCSCVSTWRRSPRRQGPRSADRRGGRRGAAASGRERADMYGRSAAAVRRPVCTVEAPSIDGWAFRGTYPLGASTICTSTRSSPGLTRAFLSSSS